MSRCIDGEVCVSCAESSRIPRLETRKDEKRRFSPLLFKTER
jgi:ribosomal protein S26